RQLYAQLRAAILTGRLGPGQRLPSTRGLAEQVGLARNTVARAYDDLLSEGYLEGRAGAGAVRSAGPGGPASPAGAGGAPRAPPAPAAAPPPRGGGRPGGRPGRGGRPAGAAAVRLPARHAGLGGLSAPNLVAIARPPPARR